MIAGLVDFNLEKSIIFTIFTYISYQDMFFDMGMTGIDWSNQYYDQARGCMVYPLKIYMQQQTT